MDSLKIGCKHFGASNEDLHQGTIIQERLLNKPYVNEVTLQKPPLKVKGLQNYRPSNFENDLTLVQLELKLSGLDIKRLATILG